MALTFTSGSTDVVDFGSDASLDDLTAFSARILARPTSLTSGRRIFAKGADNYGVGVYVDWGNNNRLSLVVNRGTTDSTSLSTNILVVNEWVDLFITYSDANGLRLYNRTLGNVFAENTYAKSRVIGAGTRTSDATTGLVFGNRVELDAGWAGDIATVSFFNAELTLAEVNLHAFGNPCLSSQLVYSELGFDGVVTQLDLSGNGNTGTGTGLVAMPHPLVAVPFGATNEQAYVLAAGGVGVVATFSFPSAFIATLEASRLHSVESGLGIPSAQTLNADIAVSVSRNYAMPLDTLYSIKYNLLTSVSNASKLNSNSVYAVDNSGGISITGALNTANSTDVNLSALLDIANSLDINLDTLLNIASSTSLSLDTLLNIASSTSLSLDTLLNISNSTDVNLPALLDIANSLDVNLDTLLNVASSIKVLSANTHNVSHSLDLSSSNTLDIDSATSVRTNVTTFIEWAGDAVFQVDRLLNVDISTSIKTDSLVSISTGLIFGISKTVAISLASSLNASQLLSISNELAVRTNSNIPLDARLSILASKYLQIGNTSSLSTSLIAPIDNTTSVGKDSLSIIEWSTSITSNNSLAVSYRGIVTKDIIANIERLASIGSSIASPLDWVTSLGIDSKLLIDWDGQAVTFIAGNSGMGWTLTQQNNVWNVSKRSL